MTAARFPNGLERRAAVEFRAPLGGRRLEGYAARFGVEARIGSFRETIMPGAFRASLAARSDILALVDHDDAKLLARTVSGTLRLAEDSAGLCFDIDVPDTTLGRDVLEMARRGDVGGMSFGFRVQDESWPANDRRELRSVDLIEISVVHAHPAYSQTSVSARSRSARDPDRESRRRFLATLA
jgi:HK97 family phage prohead protease